MPSALEYFEEIAKIPRPSGHEEKIREYLKAFAKINGLDCIEDDAGNIILRRGEPQITLQGHMDMVCEKDASCPIDMANEGLDVTHDKEWVFAKGTTLGGDDGVFADAEKNGFPFRTRRYAVCRLAEFREIRIIQQKVLCERQVGKKKG